MSYITAHGPPIGLKEAISQERRTSPHMDRLKGAAGLVQGSEEWHALRLMTIGSSEAAAVFPGISKTTTTGELFYKLIGKPREKEFDDYTKGLLERGKEMEPVFRAYCSDLLGRSVFEAPIFQVDVPGLPVRLSASPDGLITDDEGKVVLLEIKWRKDSADWKGDLGDTVFCQVQHQMLVIGCLTAYVFCGTDSHKSLWIVQYAPDYMWMWYEYAKKLCDEAAGAVATGTEKKLRTENGLPAQIESSLHLYKREYVRRIDLTQGLVQVKPQ